MTYTDLTSTIVQVSGEFGVVPTGTIVQVISTKNTAFATSVFGNRQISIKTRSIGNYNLPYEYISLVGRRENNLSHRDYPVTQTLANNPFYTGSTLYNLATRTLNHSVIATKFSAPGGKEVSSRGYMDRESEEYSVYNALPFRNYAVRSSSLEEDTKHTDLSLTASYTTHKQSRNTRYSVMQDGTDIDIPSRKYITSSNFDNISVNHQIPYHPDQMQWIYRVFAKTSGSWAVRFARDSIMTGSELYYTASVANSGTLTASPTNDYAGAYGFPMWQQIRSGDTWKNRILKKNSYIVRKLPDTNIDNVVVVQQTQLIDSGSFNTASEGSYLFKEPVVDFTNESVEYVLRNRYNFSQPLFHNAFFNEELNDYFGLIDTSEDKLKSKMMTYSGSYIRRHKKQLFPHPKHSSLNRSREREFFVFDAWRDDDYIKFDESDYKFHLNNSRQITDASVAGYTVPTMRAFNLTGSIWPLDYYTHPTTYSTGARRVTGELMILGNAYSFQEGSVLLERKFYPLASYVETSELITPGPFGAHVPWTAWLRANSVPFLDTNKKFSQFSRLKYKNYGFLAEFNVSSKITQENFSILSHFIYTESLSLYKTGSEYDFTITDSVLVKDGLAFNLNNIIQVRPYKNFYPCQFTLETAKVFSSSLRNLQLPHATCYNIMKPFFGPGILYNSIRAGLPISPYYPSASFEYIFDPEQYIKNKNFPTLFTQTLGFKQYDNIINCFLKSVRYDFCKNSSLNYFESKPDSEYLSFNSGTTYSMDIQVFAGKYDTMNSNANIAPLLAVTGGVNYLYANAVDSNIAPWWSGSLDSSGDNSGISLLRIEFTPEETRQYTLDEIFALSTKELRRTKNESGNNLQPTITGSFNCFEKVKMSDGAVKWQINSKWEFPFLAMTGGIMQIRESADGSFNSYYPERPTEQASLSIVSGQFFGGLWHDFCEVPNENQGLFLNISDVEFYDGNTLIRSASLAQQVGFSKEKKKVSELNDNLEISELICIVPVFKKNNQLLSIDSSFDMYNINRKLAQKYILPPSLDYNNTWIAPKLFFAYEIKDVWTKRDLAYVWQNLLPQNGLKFKEENSTLKVEDKKAIKIMRGREIYFKIFKCKKRGISNLPNKIGYNWPYDYFSLLELTKIDVVTEEEINR